MEAHGRRVSVIGLGYVGLPVAVALSQVAPVIGLDIDAQRIAELKLGRDRTCEVSADILRTADLQLSDDADCLKDADFHIVAVPTPIDKARQPNLSPLLSATELLAPQLKTGDIVVYESTVYPGATEEECVPLLEKISGMICGQDFHVGYSPERINPGDQGHSFKSIIKVVSATSEAILDIVSGVYASVVEAGVHRASSIRVAEAAKVIENTQRDLNIALMNELAMIFSRMGIDTMDVIDAAATKWNFFPFKPGLVGGHCIGVDPYYLTYKAKQYGFRPEVILAGRRINDGMGKYIAEQTIKRLIHAGCFIKGAKVAVLGLTFKENCPDIRNTKVVDMIHELESYGVNVIVHDPLACPAQAKQAYQITLSPWQDVVDVDAVILAVPHTPFVQLEPGDLLSRFAGARVLMDIKSVLDKKLFAASDIGVWRL